MFADSAAAAFLTCKDWFNVCKVPFTFVPRYMFYILSELLKNAVRATVEQHSFSGNSDMVPISLVVRPLATSVKLGVRFVCSYFMAARRCCKVLLRCALDGASPAFASLTQEARTSPRKGPECHPSSNSAQ